MTVEYSFAPAQSSRQRAASVAALGAVYFAEGKVETAMDHAPDYLRKAQAERELEEAKRQGKMSELAAGHSVGTGDTEVDPAKTATAADAAPGRAPKETC